MLPDGWKRTTFEKHIDLLSGNPFKSSEYSNDPADIRLLRGDNIEPGKLRWRDAKRWPVDKTHNLDRYYLQIGDFVIAMDRTWVSAGLKVTEVRGADLPCLLVQRVSRIRALPTLCQSILKQYFSSYAFENYVKSVETETAVPHISGQQIKDFPLLLPPLEEQKKIAAILSTWDRAIEETEKLLANSQQQKKALMQQLLTAKKRLPGFSGEWVEKKLSNICQIKTGKKDVNEGSESGKYPFFTCAKNHTFSNSYSYECEAILISGNGEVGKSHYYNGKFEAYQRTYILSDFKNTEVFFLLHFIEFFLHLSISKEKQHGAMPYIKLGTLKDFSILAPSLPEQRAIAAVLTTADDEITAIESDLARLRQEKKALMQQLLTGKRRVKID